MDHSSDSGFPIDQTPSHIWTYTPNDLTDGAVERLGLGQLATASYGPNSDQLDSVQITKRIDHATKGADKTIYVDEVDGQPLGLLSTKHLTNVFGPNTKTVEIVDLFIAPNQDFGAISGRLLNSVKLRTGDQPDTFLTRTNDTRVVQAIQDALGSQYRVYAGKNWIAEKTNDKCEKHLILYKGESATSIMRSFLNSKGITGVSSDQYTSGVERWFANPAMPFMQRNQPGALGIINADIRNAQANLGEGKAASIVITCIRKEIAAEIDPETRKQREIEERRQKEERRQQEIYHSSRIASGKPWWNEEYDEPIPEDKKFVEDLIGIGYEPYVLRGLPSDFLQSLHNSHFMNPQSLVGQKAAEEYKRLTEDLLNEGYKLEELDRMSTEELKALQRQIEEQNSSLDYRGRVIETLVRFGYDREYLEVQEIRYLTLLLEGRQN